MHQREAYFKALVNFVIEDKPMSSGGTETTAALHKEAKVMRSTGVAAVGMEEDGEGERKRGAGESMGAHLHRSFNHAYRITP